MNVLHELLEPFDVVSVQALSAALALIADMAELSPKPNKIDIAALRYTCVALEQFRQTLEKYQ